MEIWDDDYDCLVDEFSREEQLARISVVFNLTKREIEREIRRQHETDVAIMVKLRNLMIAGLSSWEVQS